jgi:hypothetical protein
MGWLANLVGSGIVSAFGNAILTPVLNHLGKKSDNELEGFKSGNAADIAQSKALLEAHLENNRMKAAQNAWWGARMIVLTAGWPAALQMAAVFLDSMPFYSHAVGQWGIPKPPAPYDVYQQTIVLSFFLVVPVATITNAAAAWLTRRR